MKSAMKAIACLSMVLALTVSPVLAAKDVIKIKWVGFTSKTGLPTKMLSGDLAEVEKRSNGRLKFEFRGGPEAVPLFEQAAAVRSGAVDGCLSPADFYANLVPAAGMNLLAKKSVSTDIKTGVYDFQVKIHERVGLRFIRRMVTPPGSFFYFASKKPIRSVDDFKGLSVNGGSVWETVGPALGMKPVAMGLGEQYSALQRGLIDVSGAGPNIMLFVIKVPEVTKYLITPSWGTAPASFIMNLKKWNEIPADLQELFIKTMYELAPATQIKRGKIESMYVNKMLEQGMTKIEFTGAERDKYLQTVEKATYEYYKKLAPVDGPKLYELLTQ